MDSARHCLIDSIRESLLPAFEKRGFVVLPLDAEDFASPEIRSAFPFGRLRRAGTKGLEMVEIQLHKYDDVAFRINIGIAPRDGISHATGGHIGPEEVWVHYLDRYYTMYRCPLLRQWFSVSWWSKSSRWKVEELVKSVVELIPEIELTLRDGERGRHMRVT